MALTCSRKPACQSPVCEGGSYVVHQDEHGKMHRCKGKAETEVEAAAAAMEAYCRATGLTPEQ